MKKCLSCTNTYTSEAYACQHCGFAPEKVNGVLSYVLEKMEGEGGFKNHYFKELASYEAKHFWFRARNQLIIWALKTYCPDLENFLEIGCGTGYVLSGLDSAFPECRFSGSELFMDGLSFAAERQKRPLEFMQIDARALPFEHEYDAIGAFDVLEHIEEDGQVLEQIYQALKPQGMLFLTVPQHAWLWSEMDEHACHVRRYSAKGLHHSIEAAGFKIIRSTSFVFALLPLMYLSRGLQKFKEEDPFQEFRLPRLLNVFFEKILHIERFFVRKGLNFPCGGSRLVVAQKIVQ